MFAQERPVVVNPNGARPYFKVGVLTAMVRTSMVAFALDIVFLYRLLRHPSTYLRAKCLLFLPVMYLCSPIQLIPNFIPVVRQMEDVFVIWMRKKFVRKLVDQRGRQQRQDTAAETGVSLFQGNF
jgi:uncharacterized membrane protein YkvA (DUF1232 family)